MEFKFCIHAVKGLIQHNQPDTVFTVIHLRKGRSNGNIVGCLCLAATLFSVNLGKKLPVPHCIKGTPGWELAEELRESAGKMFEKGTFGSRELAEYVQKTGYAAVELVGLCTDICVISNALLIKAFCPELPVRVDAACCAGVTPQSHENALKAMEMCQIDVIRKEIEDNE